MRRFDLLTARAAVLCIIALGFMVGSAPPASAHASLVETTPIDGQQLDAPPEQVTLTFNEPIIAPTGGLRVYDGAGERVDAGIQRELTTDTVAVELTEDLSSGAAYVATYRVVSEDGHVIRGAFVFDVGDGPDLDDDTLAALFGGGGDTALAFVVGLGRAAGYLGAFVLVGAVLWLRLVARREDDRDEALRWARHGAWLALGATLFAVPLQAMLSSGLGVAAIANGSLLAETVTGSVGMAAALRLLALAASLLLLRRPAWLLGASAVVLGSFLIDGHTRTVEPAWVMFAGDAAHLVAASAWLGGLVLLLLALRRRRSADDPVGAAALVAGFSRVATCAIVVVTVAGLAMSWANVRAVRALTTTEYGWTLLVKVGLVALVGFVGAYNHRRLVPAVQRLVPVPAGGSADVDGATAVVEDDQRRREAAADLVDHQGHAAWARLRTTVRFELIVLVVVLAVTAFLVNLRPAAEEAGISGAFDAYVQVNDELSVNLVVDPNRAGANEIHLYVLDDTGRPLRSDDLDSLQLEFELPERDIGPIVREPFVAGPGHWQVNGNDLALPGAWEIAAVLNVDRFTQERVSITVVVNP